MNEELKAFVIKIIIPALVAVSMKIAIMNKKTKVTLFQVITSFVTGIGSAYLFSSLIMDSFSTKYIPLIVAVVTISGEKIGYWIVYKLNVEELIGNFISKYTNKND